MERFEPFEPAPVLAVGVSGGADSLCLVHCARTWAERRGGRVIALIVDHGLRRESADEARTVAGWMAEAGITHEILAADVGATDAGNLEARARAGRFALLEDWCRRAGVLHLLLAHHRQDQVETVLLRLARGSGAHGLAAMTPERSLRHLRVLRPLLDCPKERLVATLAARGLPWIEDPSNRDPRFDRARLRQALEAIAADDALMGARIAHTAGAMRRTRRLLDASIDRLLARAVNLSPLGYAIIDCEGLDGADRDLAARALGLVVAAVGGGEHPPRREAMLHWLALLAGTEGGATLAGVQLTRWRDRWLVHREPAVVAAPVVVRPGACVRWDNRFECLAPPDAPGPAVVGSLAALACDGGIPPVDPEAVPRPVRSTLPAARFLDGAPPAPHLSAGRNGPGAVYLTLNVTFSPRRPLTDPVSPGGRYRIGAAARHGTAPDAGTAEGRDIRRSGRAAAGAAGEGRSLA